MTSPEKRFAALAETMAEIAGVTHPSAGDHASKGFGSSALYVNNKIFAMLTREQLVVKLPRLRVAELIAEGEGSAFESGGRAMKEWLALSAESDIDWAGLATEAYSYVGRPS